MRTRTVILRLLAVFAFSAVAGGQAKLVWWVNKAHWPQEPESSPKALPTRKMGSCPNS
jgi:hypothetical protein